MLVLTRRSGESVFVAENIEVTVVSVRGDQVRLGIAAPSDVGIVRGELVNEVRKENKEAARAIAIASMKVSRSQCRQESVLKLSRSDAVNQDTDVGSRRLSFNRVGICT